MSNQNCNYARYVRISAIILRNNFDDLFFVQSDLRLQLP